MRRLSLKWQIQLWHALILLGVLLVLGIGFYFYEKAYRIAAIDDRLDRSIHTILGPLTRFGPEGPPRGYFEDETEEPATLPDGWKRAKSPPPSVEKMRDVPLPPGVPRKFAHFEHLFVPQGHYAIGRRMDEPDSGYVSSNAPYPEIPKLPYRGYFLRTRDDRYREMLHQTHNAQVLIGYDMQAVNAGLLDLKVRIFLALLALYALAGAVGYFLVSRSVRPLRSIETTSEKIAATQLSERIPPPGPHDAEELASLTANLNATFDRLEALFQRQIRFTADASHELRTPLTALLAQIEHGLKRPRDSQEHVHILEICARSGGRIRRITEQLIELSRYDSGRIELDLEEISVSWMLDALAEELRPYIEENGSQLVTEIQEATVICDPFRLEQVMTNLINNAIQHNPSPITITLAARVVAGEFIVEVRDDGKGIQPENLDKLFDRFFQEEKSRTQGNDDFYNAGLGLSISEAIVKAHGGSIEVSSIPGVETVFRLRLPARVDPD